MLQLVDRGAFRAADLVVADTEAHAAFFRRAFGLPADRVDVALVGAEEALFRPGWQPPEPFQVLFVGKLIPLHGLDTILAAAALVPEIPFRVVGDGQLAPLLDDRPANVEHVDWIPYPELPDRLPARGVRARDLRHGPEGGARDPEQGLPGARVRLPGDHRRHAGRAGSCSRTASTRCSCRPAIRRRSPTPYRGSPAPQSSRPCSPREAGRRTRSTPPRPFWARAGARSSNGPSPAR